MENNVNCCLIVGHRWSPLLPIHVFLSNKNPNASKPSERPPSGGEMSKYLDGNIGVRDMDSSWYPKGSPV